MLAGLIWIVVTGLLARGELNHARADVRGLRGVLSAPDTAAADRTLADVARRTARAHRLTTGPAWWTAAAVPWVGGPAASLRGLTDQTAAVTRQAAPLVTAVRADLRGGRLRDGRTVDLAALTALRPDVERAAGAADTADRAVARLPHSTWLPPLDRARDDVGTQLSDLAGRLAAARTTLQVLPPLLGADTPQRFLVAFQNEAEARGTGGLPGSFAIVTAVRGTVTFERFEPSDTLVFPLVPAEGVDFGPEYDALYGSFGPYADFRDGNESPHFPFAGPIWAAMWERYSGEPVTGAVAIDPTALSYLLAATGPVDLPGGGTLTAANVVALTQHDVYERYPGTDNATLAARRSYLLDVASAAERALLGGDTDTARLVAGASRAAGERRLLVWSADPAVQDVLAGTAVGGTVAVTDQPYALLTVLNVSGSKLDYYLDRSLRWQASGCAAVRDVTVTVTIGNDAPATGLPPFVTFRADDPPPGTVTGSERSVVDYAATAGAELMGVDVDGRPATAQVLGLLGHPVYRFTLETPPGGSHTVVLRLREATGTRPVTVVTQPGVRPQQTSVVAPTCS